ncbi:thioredoxin-dependent thiol peroxidase [Candidatus Halocynthiibacter alkanivorans]|uniref:thioredoxin-dependent thiol peroxidase n=1 Tax=Candidatus Halocynthiibacter alkanivorans TaxID=2267619 RepID=UPI000DF1EEE0|nr:thioredoxin-dependent thiol peroxidase [Candidatus Halocynthiibacter alkanivorans]
MVETGQIAPFFTLPADDGTQVRLEALGGKKVVLYFYPKDNTPGCTTEALDFTALLPDFTAANTVVLGISKDSLKKHGNFRTKYDLAVTLLSDADSDMCERYGVWAEKKMYGKTFMGIVRTTVLIDENGVIARVWTKVKVAGHAAEVLSEAQS